MSKLFKSLVKRKTVFAVVLALTIFGAVYGFAATLNVGANTLSAGNASVASCQVTGTPTGTYTVAYDTTTAAYKVGTVVVTGLDNTNCLNKSVSVTLTSASGATILGSTMTGTIAASSLTLTPGTTIAASLVTGVSVAING
jgi:multisubunit Na+/H+ antiporter MnhE subunit